MKTLNQSAFLDAIAHSEIGPAMLADPASDNGYRVIVGSRPGALILMDGYDDHPRKLVRLSRTLSSTAAGRYQLLERYFDAYTRQLGLHGFGPDVQDAIALQQIRERRALDDIEAGRFAQAVAKVSNIWASLPGAGYQQHENDIASLTDAYVRAGGVLA